MTNIAERLVILARRPLPGRCKTRLSPPYHPEEAARLSKALLLDTLELAGRTGMRTAVFSTGGSLPVGIRSAARGVTDWRSQGRGGLGARMERAFRWCFEHGTHRAVMLGTDSPGLPVRRVHAAFRALRGGADVVLGPAFDGGYYLIGLSRPTPALLRDMPWSTPGLLRATAARARELHLRFQVLPLWLDVDEPRDLELLAGLDALGRLRPRPAHTLACLAELGLRHR